MAKRTRPRRPRRPRLRLKPISKTALKFLWMTTTNRRHRRRPSATPAACCGELVSEHEDVLVEILARLPGKSLMRFKCVSHRWRALIAEPHFVKKFTCYHNDLRFLFSMKPHPNSVSVGLESMMDLKYDDSLDTRKLHFPVRIDDHRTIVRVVGSCNGLICTQVNGKKFVVWNPCTNSYNLLPDPPTLRLFYGFGYDSVSDDYKVVSGFRFVQKPYPWTVFPAFEVYSLKCGSSKLYAGSKWNNLRWLIGEGTLLDGVLHWLEYRRIGKTSEIRPFSLGEENFLEAISIPCRPDDEIVGLLIHRNCLCANTQTNMSGFRIYIMKEYGVKESWEVLLDITLSAVPHLYTYTPLFILENGDFLAYNVVNNGRPAFLALYKQTDNSFNVVIRPFHMIEFAATQASIYRETLVSPYVHAG